MDQLSFLEDDHYDLGDNVRKCSKCEQLLPLGFFSRHSGANFLRAECRKCNNELSKVRLRLREKHGSAPENHVCPICLGTEEDVRGKGNTKNGSWVLDHCHETEEFRGWLCHKCNRSLGGFDDSVDMLQRAIDYLREHNEKHTHIS